MPRDIADADECVGRSFRKSSTRRWLLAALALAPAACRDAPVEPSRLTPRALKDVGSGGVAIPASMPSHCGKQLTGVAFDGTYYYVAEGQFSANNCIIRYGADGQFIDQRIVPRDIRGLHYVPATGKLMTRQYNGGLIEFDYASGTITNTYGVSAAEQVAPAPDPDGGSYWFVNGSGVEEHRLSDDAPLRSFGVVADNPYVIGVSRRWVYTVSGSTVHVYSKVTGFEVTTKTLASPLGCQGWGFGASASGDRLLEVTACDNATGQLTGMGGKGLASSCGRQLTGVAFDGTYYYVAEGQFAAYNCISRFTADSEYVDQRLIHYDMRGLHYVPATGKLMTRHYNGGLVEIDYATGTDTRSFTVTAPDQVAPAPDPAGNTFWIINGSSAEEHSLATNAVLRSFAIATDDPYVIAVSNRWFYTLSGNAVHVYSKYTGYEVATRTLTSGLGCQGWGFGASASGDRLLYVKDCGTATAELTGMNGKGLASVCGRQLTGVAWDGTYYYVAEGQFALNNCISRYTADSQYVDSKIIPIDMRGLHYVPATGLLTTRHYNGGIVGMNYATGETTVLANYRTGPDQYAPAVDPAGDTYWIINNGSAEQHRLSDDYVLHSFGVTTDDAVSVGVSSRWLYTVQGSTVHIYSKGTGYEVATQTLSSSLGCQGWGFGASANGDRLLNVKDCGTATAQLTGMGAPGLTSSCGRQLTGVAFDGTYYYVAEGQFSLNNCISRFTRDSQFVDQRVVSIDMRGLHYVPATGTLVTRHYNSGLSQIDYTSGNVTSFGAFAGAPDQIAPAPDPSGDSYWIINTGRAERHRVSDGALVTSFAITTDDATVIAVGNSWVFTHDATVIHAYEKASGSEVAAIPVVIPLGCQGWGFGASAPGDQILFVHSCTMASARSITPPPTGNTQPGTTVHVVATDPGTGNPAPVQLTFGSVATAGTTSATSGTIGGGGAPPPPAGFLLGNPATYYDIQTTAFFSGSVNICIAYAGVSFINESQLRLLHRESGGAWVDVTTTQDQTQHSICGQVTSLSPFLVAEVPLNHPPMAAAGGPYAANEGAVVTFSGAASSDPDHDALTYAWSFGDGSIGSGASPAHAYADNGVYQVTLVVTDTHGASSAPAATTATIANVAPSLGPLAIPPDPVALVSGGGSVAFSAPFTDPGTGDTHIGAVDCDGGTAGAVSAVAHNGAGTASGSCTFASAGVYTVRLTVTDDDAGSSTKAANQYIVVYDAAGGFVTGGGWILSPAGADATNPSATGKANLGFNSKYGKNASAPTGNTEFQAGNLNFSSTSYDWLVVSGAKAQYAGIGTVNGVGDYAFLLTMTDGKVSGGGGVDRFRIKIWNKSTGAIVYDNVAGGSDDLDGANPQALGGGSITIHK